MHTVLAKGVFSPFEMGSSAADSNSALSPARNGCTRVINPAIKEIAESAGDFLEWRYE